MIHKTSCIFMSIGIIVTQSMMPSTPTNQSTRDKSLASPVCPNAPRKRHDVPPLFLLNDEMDIFRNPAGFKSRGTLSKIPHDSMDNLIRDHGSILVPNLYKVIRPYLHFMDLEGKVLSSVNEQNGIITINWGVHPRYQGHEASGTSIFRLIFEDKRHRRMCISDVNQLLTTMHRAAYAIPDGCRMKLSLSAPPPPHARSIFEGGLRRRSEEKGEDVPLQGGPSNQDQQPQTVKKALWKRLLPCCDRECVSCVE